MHPRKVTAVFRRRTCFLACKFSRKKAIKFQKCFCVTLFQEFVTGIIWACLITNVCKGILNLEKKTHFKKHLSINVQQNILPRTMEWLRDATNPAQMH